MKHLAKCAQSLWSEPVGYDTGIQIYNCIVRDKVPLIVRDKELVTWYMCGPTVYDSAHLGHACSYLKLDIIQRILRQYYNLNIITLMNVTDVGEKVTQRSKEKQIAIDKLTQHYQDEFFEDLRRLDIARPHIVAPVTKNMKVILKFIEKLVQSGNAYIANDKSIYFDIAKFSKYGKLQNPPDSLVHNSEKKSSHDFALWKAQNENNVSWESPWGLGMPGWHIECAAIASHIFGPKIDFHSGGIDLRFPHHENEEAISCVYHSTEQWVNYWIHTCHLHLKGDTKMSKSLNNMINVRDFLDEHANNADIFRMLCVMTHYRSDVEFSPEVVEKASNLLFKFKNFVSTCDSYIKGAIQFTLDENVLNDLIIKSQEEIKNCLCDDFNTPDTLRILSDIISTCNSMWKLSSSESNSYNPIIVIRCCAIVANTLDLFGLQLHRSQNTNNISSIMDILNDFRQEIRQYGLAHKNREILQKCDTVRNRCANYGIKINDNAGFSSWH